MYKEFKKLIMKGDVLEMAVGIIIGGAFGKIISSLVTDIMMPPIGVLLGGVDFTALVITLKKATDIGPAVTINYGLFINTIINFVIIAFCIYIVVKQFERFKKKEEAKPVEPAEEVVLLREIRDLLKK